MVKLLGYLVSYNLYIDDGVAQALENYANKKRITPDLAIERIVKKHLR